MKLKIRSSRMLPSSILTSLFKEERRSGVILLFAAALALLFANSAWADIYFEFINKQLTFGSITLDIKHWVSEGLMALFFLVVVLEVKREFIDGELNNWRKASFPIIAAMGGMLVPAFIYVLFNPNLPQSAGWAIPVATDIAIAVGVLALLGRWVPKSLRVFLLALAIIDDIGSIVIIALFYSQPSNALALIVAITLSLMLLVFRQQKLWIFYFSVIGFCIWYCLVLSGISGTMAGVIVAALAPLTKSSRGSASLQVSEKAEQILLPIVAYVIVPLFVFCSAGLVLDEITLTKGNGLMIFIGVFMGLVVGKPLGIISASWIATKLNFTTKPRGLSWTHVIGVGFLAGIGFTISLLITDLAFAEYPKFQNSAIFGVFIASIFSGVIGLVILRYATRRKNYSK